MGRNSGHGNPSPRGRKRYMGPNPGGMPWPVGNSARKGNPARNSKSSPSPNRRHRSGTNCSGGSHDPNGCAVVAIVGGALLLAAGLGGPVALLAAYLMV